MTHNLKIEERFADAIVNGTKTFEIRKNDRGYQKGDLIVFASITTRDTQYYEMKTNHPIGKNIYQITYVLSGWGLQNGYVALAIKKVGGDI